MKSQHLHTIRICLEHSYASVLQDAWMRSESDEVEDPLKMSFEDVTSIKAEPDLEESVVIKEETIEDYVKVEPQDMDCTMAQDATEGSESGVFVSSEVLVEQSGCNTAADTAESDMIADYLKIENNAGAIPNERYFECYKMYQKTANDLRKLNRKLSKRAETAENLLSEAKNYTCKLQKSLKKANEALRISEFHEKDARDKALLRYNEDFELRQENLQLKKIKDANTQAIKNLQQDLQAKKVEAEVLENQRREIAKSKCMLDAEAKVLRTKLIQKKEQMSKANLKCIYLTRELNTLKAKQFLEKIKLLKVREKINIIERKLDVCVMIPRDLRNKLTKVEQMVKDLESNPLSTSQITEMLTDLQEARQQVMPERSVQKENATVPSLQEKLEAKTRECKSHKKQIPELIVQVKVRDREILRKNKEIAEKDEELRKKDEELRRKVCKYCGF